MESFENQTYGQGVMQRLSVLHAKLREILASLGWLVSIYEGETDCDMGFVLTPYVSWKLDPYKVLPQVEEKINEYCRDVLSQYNPEQPVTKVSFIYSGTVRGTSVVVDVVLSRADQDELTYWSLLVPT